MEPVSTSPRLLEVAVSSWRSLEAALSAGAHRVELCSALRLGGLTPDQAFIEATAESGIPFVTLIRPRAGDFNYSAAEFSLMMSSMEYARKAGASGLVSGVLLPSGGIDLIRTAELVQAARPLPFIFHRAFDQSGARLQDIEKLQKVGVAALLTAGGPGSAHAPALRALVQEAANAFRIIAAGSIRSENLPALLQIDGLREFHSAASGVHRKESQTPSSYPEDVQAEEKEIAALLELLR